MPQVEAKGERTVESVEGRVSSRAREGRLGRLWGSGTHLVSSAHVALEPEIKINVNAARCHTKQVKPPHGATEPHAPPRTRPQLLPLSPLPFCFLAFLGSKFLTSLMTVRQSTR